MSHGQFDVVVIGAGAAGLMCAGVAGQRGLRVLLLDHATKLAEKIRISGGGRANFTNRDARPACYLGADPSFCKPALAGYSAQDFIALVQSHRIGFHEKHKGQLFCDNSAEDLIRMLSAQCQAGGVQLVQGVSVSSVVRSARGFELESTMGAVCARQLVIATGGLSIPKIGATDFGYRIARQFGHSVIETRPALVPLTFSGQAWEPFSGLAGLALEARVTTGPGDFLEDLLFTHRGLSGPAVLQISSFWREGAALAVDLAPALTREAFSALKGASRKTLVNELAVLVPERLAQSIAKPWPAQQRFGELAKKDSEAVFAALKRWQLTPSGTEGYRKAEVTLGGVNTAELEAGTMQSKRVPGLFFIGEVVDVTGWLGGYNFQWAWASGVACAKACAKAA